MYLFALIVHWQGLNCKCDKLLKVLLKGVCISYICDFKIIEGNKLFIYWIFQTIEIKAHISWNQKL